MSRIVLQAGGHISYRDIAPSLTCRRRPRRASWGSSPTSRGARWEVRASGSWAALARARGSRVGLRLEIMIRWGEDDSINVYIYIYIYTHIRSELRAFGPRSRGRGRRAFVYKSVIVRFCVLICIANKHLIMIFYFCNFSR